MALVVGVILTMERIHRPESNSANPYSKPTIIVSTFTTKYFSFFSEQLRKNVTLAVTILFN